MTRVLLVGTYSSCNKGDAAMQLTAATEVRREIGAEVAVCSPFPRIDAPFYYPVPVIPSDRRRLVTATIQMARAWLWKAARKRLGQDLRGLVPDSEIQAYLEADLIVDLSGDMMTEDYGPHVAYSHFMPVLLAAILGRPYVLCAQSIGPFRLTWPLARRVLEGAALVTARDELTMEYLTRRPAALQRVHRTADLAFLLEPATKSRAREILAAESVPTGNRRILGVSVSQLMQSHHRRRNPKARDQAFVPMLAAALDRVVEEAGCAVLFVPHVTGPSRAKDDRIISRAVREAMRASSWVLEGDYGPRELKSVIGRCHVFLGARMHANIAALSSSIPVVALAYSHKTPGIMQLLGQGDLVCDIGRLSGEEIARQVVRTWGERQERAEQIRARLPGVRKSSRMNIELIRSVLDESDRNGGAADGDQSAGGGSIP